jgi:hypothetical protein
MRALSLDVLQEVAPKLPGASHADDRRHRERRAGPKRQLAR